MRNFLLVGMLCMAMIGGTLALSSAPATADTNVWTGTVVHVSTTNIKVHNHEGNQTLSFLVLPHFKQLFSDDGKTTQQMASLKPGTWVTVYYDQDLLGARHADKIVILRTGQKMGS
jgi:hypothetical protein